jgi:nicotinamidase/pyrazinamidase
VKTLIILDMQNDFMAEGTLEVPNGNSIIPIINDLLAKFDLIVATQDWHPASHKSFASSYPGKKPFEKIMLHGVEQTLWPDHCVQGTRGAEFHPNLDTRPIEAIFRKGMDSDRDSYSGFYDNYCKKSTGLAGYLRAKEAKELYFCGLCADICVYYTIKDAIKEGFNCCLIEDATCPLDEGRFQKIKTELVQKKVKFLKSTAI